MKLEFYENRSAYIRGMNTPYREYIVKTVNEIVYRRRFLIDYQPIKNRLRGKYHVSTLH